MPLNFNVAVESFEKSSVHDDSLPDEADLVFANQRCCCFVAPWYRRQTSDSTSANWWERIHAPDRSSAAGLWVCASMKLRDWSELVGGPRWKNFIRRFNKSPRNLRGSTRLGVNFHYDPLSYALNFDESPGQDAVFRDFSSRFAAPPFPAKSFFDLGGSEARPSVSTISVIPAASVATSTDSVRQ